MELAVTKCLHSSEYLSTLGAAIGKAIEKEMQDGLAAGITHGIEGRALADVAAYNPSAEADYVSALQRLQNINFSLLAELRSSKDASVDTIMNILRLEDNLAKRLGLSVDGYWCTSDTVHAPITTALSITLAFSNIVAPITVDDYGVMGTDDWAGADADPFPNMDDVDLNMP
nr:nonaspanin [Tanacetum cinerariifolium]